MLSIMENNDLKKINVGENLFQVKNKRQNSRKNKSSVSQLKPTTVKELLLQKLKQYKKEKSRKKRGDTLPKLIDSQDRSLSSLSSGFFKKSKKYNKHNISSPIINHNYGENNLEPQEPYPQQQPQEPCPQQDPEYGNLKNGKKPTYRQFQKNKTMRKGKQSQIKVNIEKNLI